MNNAEHILIRSGLGTLRFLHQPSSLRRLLLASSAFATLLVACSCSLLASSDDRAALTALYEATNGDEWQINRGWLSDKPLDEWNGVTIDERGRVVELSLHDNQLSGNVPPEIGQLTQLTRLSLHDNQLSGNIPPEVGQLTQLTRLSLGGNQLSGSIPPEIGQLTQLNSLSLWGNELSGSIPPEIGQLTQLTGLVLWGNQLSGSIPPEIGRLKRLNSLSLDDNQLSGSIPPEIGQLTQLIELVLWGNQLSGSIPPEIGQLTQLTWLFLWGNQLSGSIPPEVGQLTQLTGLSLWGNELSGSIPPEVGQLTRLTELSLWGNELSGSIPPEIGQLTQLTRLFLWGNRLIGCIPGKLRSVATNDLDMLNLPDCMSTTLVDDDRAALTALYEATHGDEWQFNRGWLSDKPLGEWHGVTTDKRGRVVELYLYDNQLSGNIPPEIGQLSQLTWLLLNGNQLSGNIPPEIGQLSQLTWLLLGGNRLIGCIPGQLRSVATNDLDELNLPDCASATSVNEDRAVLMAFYEATGGDEWPTNLGWNDADTALDQWYGVITDSDGRVEIIDLSYNDLRGEIPEAIGRLIELSIKNRHGFLIPLMTISSL